jgi:transposase
VVWLTDAPLLKEPGITSDTWIETPADSPFRDATSPESQERWGWVEALPLEARSHSITTLEVIDSHKSDEIIEVLQAQPMAVLENVKEVSVDLCGGFPKVIKEVFPNALIVIDRFHVMKLVNKALNQLRLSLELKGLKKRSLLLKNGQELTEEEKLDLQNLLQTSPCLAIAYELKEEFREIYETSTD